MEVIIHTFLTVMAYHEFQCSFLWRIRLKTYYLWYLNDIIMRVLNLITK